MEVLSPRIRAMGKLAQEDPDTFWSRAAQQLHWFRGWDSVFDWNAARPDERGRVDGYAVGRDRALCRRLLAQGPWPGGLLQRRCRRLRRRRLSLVQRAR